MIDYRLKDSVVTHFPAIFKGLGSKPSVIHMALDVELHGGVLAVRVAGCRPIDCGKCGRSTVVDLARELVRRRHRVVLVEEACGFGYSFHRQLREIGVEAFVVATESLSGKRKTNRRDANKLLDQLYDLDVNGNKKALRPIRVPTLKEQKSRRLCRMRSQLIKVRNILEAQGRAGSCLISIFMTCRQVGGGHANGPGCGPSSSHTIRRSSRCWSITRDYSAPNSNASPN